jgi:Polyketide cyclase / dehydrase and lipid transport.
VALTYELHMPVRRSVEEVFDFVGTHYFENHPRWEREVIEVRRLTDGPVGVGDRAVMVRQEYGRRSEAPLEVTAFEPPRTIAFRHVDSPMLFELALVMAPAGATSTDLSVHVRVGLQGRYRLLTPMFAFNLPRIGKRIMRTMVELIEAEPSHARVDTRAAPR